VSRKRSKGGTLQRRSASKARRSAGSRLRTFIDGAPFRRTQSPRDHHRAPHAAEELAVLCSEHGRGPAGTGYGASAPESYEFQVSRLRRRCGHGRTNACMGGARGLLFGHRGACGSLQGAPARYPYWISLHGAAPDQRARSALGASYIPARSAARSFAAEGALPHDRRSYTAWAGQVADGLAKREALAVLCGIVGVLRAYHLRVLAVRTADDGLKAEDFIIYAARASWPVPCSAFHHGCIGCGGHGAAMLDEVRSLLPRCSAGPLRAAPLKRAAVGALPAHLLVLSS